jgi:hypothetical protein
LPIKTTNKPIAYCMKNGKARIIHPDEPCILEGVKNNEMAKTKNT